MLRDGLTNVMFFSYAKNGDLEGIQRLIAAGVDVNIVNVHMTALHYALYEGHEQVAKYLIAETNINVDVRDFSQKTPLHLACEKKLLSIVKLLVKKGADVNAPWQEDISPAHYAYLHGNTEIASWLIEEAGALVSLPPAPDPARPLLDLACDVQDNSFIQRVVEKYDFDSAKLGVSLSHLLYRFCETDNLDLFNWLLHSKKVDINVKYNDETCMHHAVKSMESHEILKKLLSERPEDILIRAKDGNQPFHVAILAGNVIAVRLLLEMGAKITERGKKESLPIHCAAARGYHHLFPLLNYGANEKNIDGNTALHLAAMGGHLATVEILINNYGADALQKNFFNETALDLARTARKNSVVSYLRPALPIPSKLDVVDANGDNLLHSACEEGNLSLVNFLLENTAIDLKGKNHRGYCPIHLAALYGHTTIFKRLVDKGVDPQIMNERGQTSLHIASAVGHLEIVSLLVNHYHVDISKLSGKQLTALDLALDMNKIEVAQFLLKMGAGIKHQFKKKMGLYWVGFKNSLLIGATCENMPMVGKLAINTNQDLAEAIEKKTALNYPMLRRAIQLKLISNPEDKELKTAYHLLTSYPSLKQACFFKLAQIKTDYTANQQLPAELIKDLKEAADFESHTIRLTVRE